MNEYTREQITAAVHDWLKSLFPGRVFRAQVDAQSRTELPVILLRRTREVREWPRRTLMLDLRILASGEPLDAAADATIGRIEAEVPALRVVLPGTQPMLAPIAWDLDGDTEGKTVEADVALSITYYMVGDNQN